MTLPQASTLDCYLNFRNGKTSPERDDSGDYPVFGSNGRIGRSFETNAEGPMVVIGRVGSYCGSLSYSQGSAWVTDNAIVCTPKAGRDARYWYFALGTLDLNGRSSGSGQPLLNQKVLGSILFTPPNADQRLAIAEVLGTLDDKIAANTDLAQVADEWVRTSLDALLFGAAERKPIAEVVSNRRDQVSPGLLAAETLYVGLEHVPRRSMWLAEVGSAGDVTSPKNRFEHGDLLFGKLRPYFHKVVAAPHGGVCSTDVLVLSPIHRELDGFALAAVSSDAVVRDVTSASEGTRMPRTSWKDLGSVEVPWPGLTAARRFSAEVSAVRDAVQSHLRENRTLAATRDALLPQLMSGKLRVKDAEKVLEGVL
ncbi:restriction endonuclease subunit S [Cryobacterium sp. TMT1-2-1]|uniref:restriction endonuclease subunit S n=1 Tax=Cryobacterium sp. TMT1-2-1 TaxID=1259232 RepID=UPI00106B0DDA|nr:restriction endonuclease subunit S [Cryobacterium sp. TMT1-2-1]TFD47160.1 restriction endonuclease subunit S [Cryobacterium sp. TMT1-2-1]